MKALFCSFALLFLYVSISKSSDVAICGNPLFETCSSSFFCSVPFLQAPVARVNTGICPSIPAGTPSCCDQTVYDAITTAWLIGRAEVQQSVDELEVEKQNLNLILDELQALINNVSNSYPGLTDQQKNNIVNALQSVVDITRGYFGTAVSDWANCARGILNYYAGLLCFGCDAYWNLYVSFNNATNQYNVLLDKTTCTEVTGQCIAFFQDFENYAIAISSAAQKIAQAIGSASSSENIIPVDDVKDLCNGNCANYVCYSFMVGLTFDNPAAGGDGNSEGSNYKREARAAEAVAGTVEDLINRGKLGLGTKLVKHLGKMESGLEKAHGLNEKMSRGMFEKRSSQNIVNVYGDNGYPAYSNGKSSGLDTSVSGSSSAVLSWMKWLL